MSSPVQRIHSNVLIVSQLIARNIQNQVLNLYGNLFNILTLAPEDFSCGSPLQLHIDFVHLTWILSIVESLRATCIITFLRRSILMAASKKSKQGGKSKSKSTSNRKKAAEGQYLLYFALRCYHLSLHLTSRSVRGSVEETKGCGHISLPHSFLTPSSAENDALCKVVAAKENTMIMMMIPQPPSGSSIAGNGFNLQIAMHLEDDTNLYTALHVS